MLVDLDQGSRAPYALLHVRGELDLGTSARLQQQMQGLVQDGYRCVDLDLTAVPFCDLAGLDVLVTVGAMLSARGGGCWCAARARRYASLSRSSARSTPSHNRPPDPVPGES